MLSQALLLGASAQLRNMATIGGNLLQRTRCPYFRDTATAVQQARAGLGLLGARRLQPQPRHPRHERALHRDASVGPARRARGARRDGARRARARTGERDRLPSPTSTCCRATHPERETVLRPGELITAIDLPALPFARTVALPQGPRSRELRVRAGSAAVALDVANGTIREARVALGGVATKPWRSTAAERALVGQARRPRDVPRGGRRRARGRACTQGQRVQGRAGEAHARARAHGGVGMSDARDVRRGRSEHRHDRSIAWTAGSRSPAARSTRPNSRCLTSRTRYCHEHDRERHGAAHGHERGRAGAGRAGGLTPRTRRACRQPPGAAGRRWLGPAHARADDPAERCRSLQRPADRPRHRRHVRARDGRRRAGEGHVRGGAPGAGRRRRHRTHRARQTRPVGNSGTAYASAATSAQGLADADVKVEHTYTTPFENHNPDGAAQHARGVGRRQAHALRLHAGHLQRHATASRARSGSRRRTCGSSRTSPAADSAARAVRGRTSISPRWRRSTCRDP